MSTIAGSVQPVIRLVGVWTHYGLLHRGRSMGLLANSQGTVSVRSHRNRPLRASGLWSNAASSAPSINSVKKYLPLYVAEFEFCYNNRMNASISGTAISAC